MKEERLTALARPSSSCKEQTRPPVREGSPLSTGPQLSHSNNNLVVGRGRGLTPRQTGRLAIDRNVTLTLASDGSWWEEASPEAEESPPLEAATKQRTENSD
jgi:hypothetical protein